MHDGAYAHDLQMLNARVTPRCYSDSWQGDHRASAAAARRGANAKVAAAAASHRGSQRRAAADCSQANAGTGPQHGARTDRHNARRPAR
jgi:hypothetical protein